MFRLPHARGIRAKTDNSKDRSCELLVGSIDVPAFDFICVAAFGWVAGHELGLGFGLGMGLRMRTCRRELAQR